MELIIIILFALVCGLGYQYWNTRNRLENLRRNLTSIKTQNTQLATTITDKDARIGKLESKSQVTQKSLLIHEALSNSAYNLLLILDSNNSIVSCNEMAQEVFNITKSGNTLAELKDMEYLSSLVEQIIENKEDNFEEQITIREFTYRVRMRFLEIDAEKFIAVALQDVTQLIQLNRARRDMVANISHELRTPIANIRLIIDSLFHEHDKPKRKDSISSLRSIAQETDALLWLVQEMADLSMIESGQAIVRMVEVPLGAIINEAVDRLSNQSEAKNITFVQHIPEKINVLCDRDLIQRVVVNLLHNAMKWSPKNEAVTISAVAEGDEVVISVFDNGPGVSEDQVDRIFERFYQVDASRSGHEGTGLGLAICKHIVVAHGGRIWAESNIDGAGGRFLFTLLNVDVTESEGLESTPESSM